ncbi:MAG: histidine phosphatase family protein [Candidatus Paceibacterota bacterium]|jgi:hypothetical protein
MQSSENVYEGVVTTETAEQFSSKIELRFLRHDEKEKDPTKSDTEIRLTPKGKLNAKAQADEEVYEAEHLAQTVAFGSPRKRAQETAGLVMAGALDDITGTESLEELKTKINTLTGLKYGSKIHADKRLDFIIGESEYATAGMEAFKNGQFLRFLVDKSDELAREAGDEVSFTYTRGGMGIAQIIQKYLKISERFDELVKKEDSKYKKEMDRLFGTHQTVQECFLLKVIEKIQGVDGREQFMKAVGNTGFNFSEGFTCDVVTTLDGEKKIHVVYKKDGKIPEENYVFDAEIPAEIVNQIAEGK